MVNRRYKHNIPLQLTISKALEGNKNKKKSLAMQETSSYLNKESRSLLLSAFLSNFCLAFAISKASMRLWMS